MLVRLAGRGRPQSHRTTTEPLQPLLRTQAAPRAIGVNLPQPLPMETVLRGRCWVIDGDTIVIIDPALIVLNERQATPPRLA